MAERLYRCINPKCGPNGHEFTGESPAKCPKCGIAEDDPKLGLAIRRLVLVHFDPPSPLPGIGMGYRACNHQRGIAVGMPSPDKPGVHAGTGDPRSVTCPKCKESEEYTAAMAAFDDD